MHDIQLNHCNRDKFIALIGDYLRDQGINELLTSQGLFCHGGLVQYTTWNRRRRTKLVLAVPLTDSRDEDDLDEFIDNQKPLTEKVSQQFTTNISSKLQQAGGIMEIIIFPQRDDFRMPDHYPNNCQCLDTGAFIAWITANESARSRFDSTLVALERSLEEQQQLNRDLKAKHREAEFNFEAYKR